MASLPDDFWVVEESSQRLIGKRTRLTFQLAQSVEVRLAEARPVTGGLIFNLITGGASKPKQQPQPSTGKAPGHRKSKLKRRR